MKMRCINACWALGFMPGRERAKHMVTVIYRNNGSKHHRVADPKSSPSRDHTLSLADPLTHDCHSDTVLVWVS